MNTPFHSMTGDALVQQLVAQTRMSLKKRNVCFLNQPSKHWRTGAFGPLTQMNHENILKYDIMVLHSIYGSSLTATNGYKHHKQILS